MFGSRDVIGLDIGTSSIKLVRLKKGKKGFELLNCGIMPLPPETIVEGTIEKPEVVTNVIKNLLKIEKIKVCDVVTAVSGQSVVIKKINVPKMTEDELAESIRVEAEQYIPFDIDDVNLDFQIIKETTSEKKEEGEEVTKTANMDVLLVAVRRDLIAERNKPVIDAGLKPLIVDLDVFAMENEYEHNYGFPQSEVLALVNMGATFTNVNILVDGVTEFTRDISSSGNRITHELQKNFNMDYDAAEKLKMGVGLNGVSEKDVANTIVSVLGEISHEINKMFHDFIKSTEKNINRVILSGGCARISGIEKILTENFDIPTEKINPFEKIKVNPKIFDPEYIQEMAPVFAIGVGLAIRRLGDKVKP
ncbi:MAG: type IV pilus assembly protein PilM [Nitrospinae bacterium]|nr:type IV pilus assembly protein PilM [Nitrospinota bacterium]